MKPQSFIQLKDEFFSAINDPDATIEFYNRNALFLNNIKTTPNKDDLFSYIQIVNKFSGALYQKKRFHKTIEFVNSKLPLIDAEITKFKAAELKNDWYYYILFNKAAALYTTNKFSESHRIFLELVDYDAENEQFKNWLKFADRGFTFKLLKIISYISVAVIFGAMIFKPYFHNQSLRTLVLAVGFISGFCCIGYDAYLRKSLKKLQ